MDDTTNPAGTPAPAPSPTPTGATTPPSISMPAPSGPAPYADPNHPGWAPGAYERFRQQGAELSRLKAEADALRAQASRVATLERDLAATQARAAQDLALTRAAASAPNLAHASVQHLFRSGYDAYRADGGDAPFAAWLTSDQVKADPVYGVHLTAPAPVTTIPTPDATPAPAPTPTPAAEPPPRVDGAAAHDDPATGTAQYTDAQIAAISSDPNAWAKHGDAIRAQYEAKYGRKLGRG